MLLDEEEEKRRQPRRQEVFRAFKAQREEVEYRREQDRLDRNAQKEKQLLYAEELQVNEYYKQAQHFVACLLKPAIKKQLSRSLVYREYFVWS